MSSKKDSYWFRHDATAGRALKMRKMSFKFDHWGKGVYWDVIEILRDQSGYKYESNKESLALLADLIGCKDVEKFEKWFKECLSVELFKEKDGFFYSEILSKNMVKWEVKKKNGSSKKKRKVSETEAKVEDKIRLDKITEHNRTKDYIISVANQKFNKKVSLVLLEDFTSLFETCMMTNYPGKKKDLVLNAMDRLYPVYDFNDQNHLLKALQKAGSNQTIAQTPQAHSSFKPPQKP